MKKSIYESFVKTHLTYCLTVWGAKKTSKLNELKKALKKIWTKIGPRHQRTNSRLKDLQILKLEDELKIMEIKYIWRWVKSKLPLGIRDIIKERGNARMRNRNFERPREWKNDSIAYRLATRANKEIKEIELAKTKKGLVKKYKQKCFLIDYSNQCRIRNCRYCPN